MASKLSWKGKYVLRSIQKIASKVEFAMAGQQRSLRNGRPDVAALYEAELRCFDSIVFGELSESQDWFQPGGRA
jgi:hypothetical protein